MKLRKWIAAAAALCMAVGLTACGGKTDGPEETKEMTPKQEIHYALTSECHYQNGVPIPLYEYTYDNKGQLTRITLDQDVEEYWDEEYQVYRFRIYSDGNINTMKSLEYDQSGLVSSINYTVFAGNETTEGTIGLEYTYDSTGMVTSCVKSDDSGKWSSSWIDFFWLNGKLIKESAYEKWDNDLGVETYSYEYLDNGMISGVLVDGISVGVIYDGNGRVSAHHLKSMETGIEIKIPASYDGDGNPLPGRNSDYVLYFDEHGNLSRVEEDGETIVVYTYQPFVYDPAVFLDGQDIARIRQREYLNHFVPGFLYADYVYGIELEYTYTDYINDIG